MISFLSPSVSSSLCVCVFCCFQLESALFISARISLSVRSSMFSFDKALLISAIRCVQRCTWSAGNCTHLLRPADETCVRVRSHVQKKRTRIHQARQAQLGRWPKPVVPSRSGSVENVTAEKPLRNASASVVAKFLGITRAQRCPQEMCLCWRQAAKQNWLSQLKWTFCIGIRIGNYHPGEKKKNHKGKFKIVHISFVNDNL